MGYDDEKHEGYCDARQWCDGHSVDEIKDRLNKDMQARHRRKLTLPVMSANACGYLDGFHNGLLAELPDRKRIRIFVRETRDVVYEVDVDQDYDITTSDEDYPWTDEDKVSDDIDEIIVGKVEVI